MSSHFMEIAPISNRPAQGWSYSRRAYFLFTALIVLFTSLTGRAQVSDDFSASTLNTSLWTFVNPLGDGTSSLSGGKLLLSVPQGTSHDVWTNGNPSVRVMQTISN